MSDHKKQEAPAANQGPATASHDDPTLPDTCEGIDPTGLIAGVYVAVVQVRGDHVPRRYRRRTYWNLPSAQRALDRATTEGLEAHLVLCRLMPVGEAE
ncbi:hypothetical protein [Paeniglutamicibacter antarcticus]|uniref:SPOR domain-containing protein n=1 Tax=Paeniglutamicibacter antarcticus TaxID=494023 RepID=A0ABP9TK55_9MICC